MRVGETRNQANAVGQSHGQSQDEEAHPRKLADSLYEGSLDHVIRNNPSLFLAPKYWTNRHSELLHVDCREGWRWTSSKVEPSYGTKEHEYKDPVRPGLEEIQHHTSPADISVTAPVAVPANHAENGVLRVPRFQYPRLELGERRMHVGALISNGASYWCLMNSVARLLVEEMSDSN